MAKSWQGPQTVTEPVDVWSAAGVSHSLLVGRILNTLEIAFIAVMDF